ncbi:hypothetical protein AGMMS50262_05190 [Bacteroidia bacterium]|nr:hypothetical protein AGMMS50262_05190 [Bacteroidia bacterium]
MKQIIYFLLFFFAITEICAQSPKEEIRAVWLTTNYALDWPKKPFKNSNDINQQQDELIDILDQLKAANFNVVFLQARLRGDVIYNSAIEPVSPYIQGVKNTWSKYDPLAFAIEECHKRGLECHAWFVTYPMGQEKDKNSKKKSFYRTYNGEVYLDPGDPQTNNYLLSLIDEIVEKYDIDGIHLDYIRYPEKGANFPDKDTYQRYGKGKEKTDWRRENINKFVSELYDRVKNKKSWVQVSSSVVGMYEKIEGDKKKYWTAYHSVFQDPENWLAKGKHDFIVPMMYYADGLFFPFIQNWKTKANGRYIVPGLGLYQMDEHESNWNPQTIVEQIRYSRDNHMSGNAFFRAQHICRNKKGISDEIKSQFYQYPAVCPPLKWLDKTPPVQPVNLKAVTSGIYLFLSWDKTVQPENKQVFFNVYRSETWPIDTQKAEHLLAVRLSDTMLFIPIDNSVVSGYYYAVSSYDRFHNESILCEPVYFVTGEFQK